MDLLSSLHSIGTVWSRYYRDDYLLTEPDLDIETAPVAPGTTTAGEMEFPVPDPVPKGQYEEDIANIAPAERHTIEFEANIDLSIYLMHRHKVTHAMNGESYPGGMVNAIVYRDAMDTDIFANLMKYAGYDG